MKRHTWERGNLSLPGFATWEMFFKNIFFFFFCNFIFKNNKRRKIREMPLGATHRNANCSPQMTIKQPTIQLLLDKPTEAPAIFGQDGLHQPRSSLGRQPEAPWFMQTAAQDLHRTGRWGRGGKDAWPNNRFDRCLLAAAQWGETTGLAGLPPIHQGVL